MRSGSSFAQSTRRRARNKAALVLFGRAAVSTMAVVAGWLGFLAGIELQKSNFDPYAYATGVGALFATTCAIIAFMLMRQRAHTEKVRALETRVEELSDDNWELREAEDRARDLLESQGDLIVRRDANGRVTFANDAFCALAGQREAIIGRVTELSVIEQGPMTVLADRTRVHDQNVACGENPRWIAWREAAVRGENGTEMQSVGRDVTYRVEAERAFALARDHAETANRSKSRFLATVSHEIRTPLNGILGMADLLLDTELTPEQLTYAKAAKTSGETLLALIGDILDFSKIEAGKLELEARPFALALLVEETVELLAPRAQAKGIDIASFVDDRLPRNVVGDAARLRQVLLNLAGNAIKFTEKGGVAVIVEPDAQPDEIRFQVRDTGIGLAPQDQARIFLDFEQADGSATRKFGGTGLGLAISKRIVERMDGGITVDSEAGRGATFRFSVPLKAATGSDPAANFVTPDLSGETALIVAAAEIESSLLARRIEGWGAKSRVAPDTRSATALLKERRWDALLVDYPLAQRMIANGDLSRHDGARSIVLIKPTERHELPTLKARGFTGYLVKPVRAASLAARLREQDAFEDMPAEIAAGVADDARSEGKGRTNGKSLSILVAEDNEINALLTRVLLTRLGHRPTITSHGEAAVESWAAARATGQPYDLVLMDVQMPGMDGFEAARRIRATEAAANDRPVRMLALTANAQTEDREACVAAGMDGLLVKPLDRERLREALAAVAARLAA
ncbi:MAG: ATP-binding protein [Pseudolabrys sp.]